MKFSVASLMCLALLVALPHGADADINYGDFSGATVDYIQVTEDSTTDPGLLPMYGAPTVSGDTLDFNPTGFAASSSAGVPDITDGNLTFGINAQSGSFINEVQFSEAGDFTMVGIGTDTTFVDITATFFVDVYEVDGNAISTITATNSMTFTPEGDGTFALLTDGGGGPLYQGIWTGSVSIDIDALLADNGIDFVDGATKVSVNLDNTLVALSEAGTTAFVAKKDFKGVSITTIPEPASVAMLLGTSCLLGFARRRFVV